MSKELKERQAREHKEQQAREQELERTADRAFKHKVYMATNAVLLTLLAWGIVLVVGGGLLWFALLVLVVM